VGVAWIKRYQDRHAGEYPEGHARRHPDVAPAKAGDQIIISWIPDRVSLVRNDENGNLNVSTGMN